jgi:hypothetical protein
LRALSVAVVGKKWRAKGYFGSSGEIVLKNEIPTS